MDFGKLDAKTQDRLVQFGNFIKEERTKKELYQYELAEMLGVTQSYISHIERGERDIDLSLLLKLCDVLDANFGEYINIIRKE